MSQVVIPDVSQPVCLEQLRKALSDIMGLDQITNLVDTHILKIREGVNAVIGENNSGKSSFIDAIRLALGVGSYKKVLAPGGISHSGPGGNRQFGPKENSQS